MNTGITAQLSGSLAEGQRRGTQMVWDAIWQLLLENWPYLLGFLLITLALAIIKFAATGRWGFLASVLYRCLYLSLLLILIKVLGPEIFLSVWGSVIFTVLYVICFEIVGVFLNMTGIRHVSGKRPY